MKGGRGEEGEREEREEREQDKKHPQKHIFHLSPITPSFHFLHMTTSFPPPHLRPRPLLLPLPHLGTAAGRRGHGRAGEGAAGGEGSSHLGEMSGKILRCSNSNHLCYCHLAILLPVRSHISAARPRDLSRPPRRTAVWAGAQESVCPELRGGRPYGRRTRYSGGWSIVKLTEAVENEYIQGSHAGWP